MKLEENENIELKKSTAELKEGIISIAAILNKHGKGELYFGVKNDGTVVGQDVGDETLRDVSQAISNHIEPKIYPEITKERLNNLDIIKVRFRGAEKPYFAYGRIYLRVADEDRQLSPKAIEKLILEKNIYKSRWDSELSDLDMNDINQDLLLSFVKKSRLAGRLPVDAEKPEEVLLKLGLIKKNKLTLAAKYLFTAKHDIEVQAAVFATNEKLNFLDIRKFNQPLPDMLEASEAYIKEKINWRVEFIDFKRVEIPEIPIKAIREALVNSLIHRDFNNPKGNEIAIYKDRIEIYNPGAFPPGLTPEDYIYKQERSYLRNPKIAEVFYLTKDVEKWGSGLKRIYNECKENGVKVSFASTKTGVITTFIRPVSKTEKVGEKVGEKVTEKVTKKVTEKVTKNQKKILTLMKADPYITTQQLSALIGISARKIKENISKLKNKNLLKRIGSAKGGHWLVTDEDNTIEQGR